GFDPQPLEAAVLPPDHIVSIAYTGGTTGKPKGVIGSARTIAAMTQVQMSEWEWPESPRFLMCTPLAHAGAAFFVPTVLKGGPLFAQYYGQSEAPMVISYLAKADHLGAPVRLSSCGRPSAFVRAALLGEDGDPVPQGEPGEICVAGPLLAGGYWNLPDETAAT